MSDEVLIALNEARNRILEERHDSEAYIEEFGPALEAAHKHIARCNDKLRQLDAAIQDRIVPLTPAPEAEPGSDALAEFMKREGAVKWDGADVHHPHDIEAETRVEVLYRDGCVSKRGGVGADQAWTFQWSHRDNSDTANNIIAYRIISEPAGEGVRLPTMDDIIDPDFTGGLTTEEYLARLHAGTLEPYSEPAGYQHVVDAEPAPVLRADVPPDAVTYLAPSGELFATFNGSTHLVINDPPAEQSEPYSAAHEAEEPAEPATSEELQAAGVIDPEAVFWARKLEGVS